MRRYHTLFDGRLQEHRTSLDALRHLGQSIVRSHAFCSGLAETDDGHVEIRQILVEGEFIQRCEQRSGSIESFHFPSAHELVHHMRQRFAQADRDILGAESFPYLLASIRARFKTTRGLERAIVNHLLDGDRGLMDGFPHLAEADMESGYEGEPMPPAWLVRMLAREAPNASLRAPAGTAPLGCPPGAQWRFEEVKA